MYSSVDSISHQLKEELKQVVEDLAKQDMILNRLQKGFGTIEPPKSNQNIFNIKNVNFDICSSACVQKLTHKNKNRVEVDKYENEILLMDNKSKQIQEQIDLSSSDSIETTIRAADDS